MGPNHDHIAIGDTGIVQIMSEDIGCLIDLAVGESSLWRCRRLGLDDADAVWVSFGRSTETLMDGADKACPIEVHSRIGEL